MSVVMNMSSYEIEPENRLAEYGEEVLCAGWNPQLSLVNERSLSLPGKPRGIPCELVEADIETFLQKMYSYQR